VKRGASNRKELRSIAKLVWWGRKKVKEGGTGKRKEKESGETG
jgi:hypothetical protein